MAKRNALQSSTPCASPDSSGCACIEPCTEHTSDGCSCGTEPPATESIRPAYAQHRFTLPREYLSASQINMVMRCAKQYEFRYVEGLILPPNVAMLTGTGVHAGNEVYFQDIIDNKQPLLPAQVAEFAIAEIEAEAAEKDILFEGDIKDNIISVVKNVVEGYLTHVAPMVHPLAVEYEFRYTSRCGVDVMGFIDLIRAQNDFEQKAGLPPGSRIVDYKITDKKWAQGKLANDFQFSLYDLAVGIPNIEVHNVTKTLTKTKVNKQIAADYLAPVQDIASNIRIIRNEFGPVGHDHIENIVEDVARLITSGIFPRCQLDSWCCNEKWCGYWKLCRGKGV